MPIIMPGRKSITTVFTEEEYDQIKILAAKKNTSMNEIIRGFTIHGLNGTLTQQNLDVIVPVIREQLKSIIDPSFERLSTLTAKTCVQAGTAAYLTAETIAKLVPPGEREEVEKVYYAARKKSVQYTKGKSDLLLSDYK